jgi:hypothetical protein
VFPPRRFRDGWRSYCGALGQLGAERQPLPAVARLLEEQPRQVAGDQTDPWEPELLAGGVGEHLRELDHRWVPASVVVRS